MTPAIAALAASFALIGAASAEAQDPAGDTGSVAAQTSPAPDKPDIRPVDTPKLRDQLLQGAINVLLKPRPRPAPPQTAPPPVEPAPAAVIEPPIEVPAAVIVEPSPPAPRPAAIVPVTPVVGTVAAPRPKVAPAKPALAPQPRPSAASPPSVEPAPAPPSMAEPAETAPPTAVIAADPIPASAPEADRPGENSIWLLLGLLAAAAAAVAAAVHLRRVRRIARTRAALSLYPSLNLAAGACSFDRLALAGPPLTIRARLDLGEAIRG